MRRNNFWLLPDIVFILTVDWKLRYRNEDMLQIEKWSTEEVSV
jgi:hypothetical protein